MQFSAGFVTDSIDNKYKAVQEIYGDDESELS